MATKKTSVHGFTVEYEENFYPGIEYLKSDLQYNEAKVIFEMAKIKGSAEFEDDEDRDWTILYNKSKGIFTLIRRSGE